jgi:hypothetical protein
VWYSLPAVSSNAGEAKSGIGVDMMVRGKGRGDGCGRVNH